MTVDGRRLAEKPHGARVTDDATPLIVPLTVPAVGAAETLGARNEVEWIDTPAALRVAVKELAAAPVVGLDVETTLDFKSLCLVQLATSDRTFLIDPFSTDLNPLSAVLTSPRPVKVIHNARFERRVLGAEGIVLEGVFDTLEVSRRLRGKDMFGGHSLAVVCQRELGVGLDKSAQTSNWSRRPLDADQIRYAAVDAEVLLALHERFFEE